ncbi:MAG: hypothetical protein GXZ18_03265 [Synergistaceae bacterium]|nr:hypothetical protein [Synergistaceae bacterium]
MVSRIVTDYFTWNVLAWTILYIFTVIAVGLVLLLIIKNHSDGVVYKETIKPDFVKDSSYDENRTDIMIFIDNCMDIWFNAALSDIAAILMLILFFVVAVI